MNMLELNMSNFQEVRRGDTILYDNYKDIAEEDSSYRGGIRVGGMSLVYVIENYDRVYLVRI